MRTRYALLAAALIVSGAGIARAQQAWTYDPSQLPAIQGKVADGTEERSKLVRDAVAPLQVKLREGILHAQLGPNRNGRTQ